MEDNKNKEVEKKANEILDRHISQTKIVNKHQNTIDSELENIKRLILKETTANLKSWYSNKETDLNSLNTIVNSIDYGLSDKTIVKLKGVTRVHGLNGKYVDSIEVDYKIKFDEDSELEYKEKTTILLESVKLRSKLSKLK